MQMCLLVRHMGGGAGIPTSLPFEPVATPCAAVVSTVWVICLLIERQPVDNLLAQVRKFRKQVVWQMLRAGKFPDLLPKIRESGVEKAVGSKAL